MSEKLQGGRCEGGQWGRGGGAGRDEVIEVKGTQTIKGITDYCKKLQWDGEQWERLTIGVAWSNLSYKEIPLGAALKTVEGKGETLRVRRLQLGGYYCNQGDKWFWLRPECKEQ